MTVLVSGATSQIGRFLLPRLVQAHGRVQAVSRQPQPAQDGVQWLCGDLAAALDSVPSPDWQAIASFGPIEALAQWLSQQTAAPARQVIATSSMSVLSKQNSEQADEQDVVAMLQRGETGLIAQAERLGMGWTILRPTLIYGAGIDRSITPIVQRALRLRLFPIPLVGGLRQPVHADDIARAVVACIATGAASARVLEIGGGERLPYHAMFRRVHASLAQPTLALPLPGAALRGLAAVLPRARGPVSRLQQDLIADNGPLQALLDVHPRPFQPDADTWRPMSAAQAVQRIAAYPGNG
ncbi:hypothetical protein U4I37_20680 [Stenotrophomonas maltophilia]|uniref:SDR family oxidoreductase n=1 Tax=Stenotrophomonas maltophilia TaxID=40324 RepID=UPI001310AE05|nr:NAD-dependent epimerase/dehydratase family protein [Stenotrophomonas maltophilia]MDZ5788658.1 hypothetical protein [Stenotrophomonas maltophilia]HDS1553754.1 hypothetical protein [Stenotrophomonas maltophilia]